MGFGDIAKLVTPGGQVNALGDVFGGGQPGENFQENEALRQQLLASGAAQQKLAGQAQDYRSNLGNTRQQAYGMADTAGRRQLAQNLAGNAQGAQSRGMLFSGAKQGADIGARSGYATGAMNARNQINAQTEAQAQGMENQALQAGMQQQQAGQHAQDAAYQQALMNKQSRNQGLSSLMGGIGGGFGALAGRNG